MTKKEHIVVPRRWLAAHPRVESVIGLHGGGMGRLYGIVFLLLGAAFSGTSAEGQLDRSPMRTVASGSVTLIATLETLGVTVTPTGLGEPFPTAIQPGLQTYAITTRSAIVAHRTTVHLSCVVAGRASADGACEVFLPLAVRTDETNAPATRTDLLNIRLNNGTELPNETQSPTQRLDIIAQAL